jgi:hypothetical protein
LGPIPYNLFQVSVALDGRTYIGAAVSGTLGDAFSDPARDRLMFFTVPAVVSAYPTNGLFDAQTEITVGFLIFIYLRFFYLHFPKFFV